MRLLKRHRLLIRQAVNKAVLYELIKNNFQDIFKKLKFVKNKVQKNMYIMLSSV